MGRWGDREIERWGDKKRETLSKGDGGIKRWETLKFRNSECGLRGAELRSKQCGDIEPSGGIGRNGGWETSKRQKAVRKVQNAELN